MGVPLGAVLIAMNIVYALGAYPAGVFSDRYPADMLLGSGLGVLVVADLALALWHGLVGTFVGIMLWGLHMSLTQGLMAKLVADHSPSELRGSAYGLFNLASGAGMLAASVLAGLLWDMAGASATFLAGAGITTIAGIALRLSRRRPA